MGNAGNSLIFSCIRLILTVGGSNFEHVQFFV